MTTLCLSPQAAERSSRAAKRTEKPPETGENVAAVEPPQPEHMG